MSSEDLACTPCAELAAARGTSALANPGAGTDETAATNCRANSRPAGLAMMERSDSLCGERDGARTRSIFTAAFVDAFPAGFDFDDDPGRFFAALTEPDRDDNFFRTIIASPSTKIGVCAAHGTPD
jgi:hypothetical protein